MISLGDRTEPNPWRPPVLKTVAARGEGIDEVMTAIDDHYAWMESSGVLRDRRVRRAGNEIEAIAIQALRSRIGDLRQGKGVDELAAHVVDGSSDPYSAADQVVAALT
jgi:LAO/AO transport system kinase